MMKSKTIFLVVLFTFFVSCVKKESNNHRSIKVSSGKNIEIYFEKHDLAENYSILLVECETEKTIAKEAEIEKDVAEIWTNIESIADEQKLEEATIKYKFPTEDVNEKGEMEKVYVISVFAAERMENSKWKIDKIS